MIETVFALLMFVNGEIKEHRIQPSMGMCLRGKREAVSYTHLTLPTTPYV